MKTITDELIKELTQIAGPENVQRSVSMAEHTSFRAGGPADLFVTPQTEQQLQEILQKLAGQGVPHMVLGNGSNILVRDGGYRGVIVHIGTAFNHIRREGDTLICGSGTLLSAAAKRAAAEGLTGLEFASGIPGSVGGAVFMNAGAYGGEIRDVLEHARVLVPAGAAQDAPTEESPRSKAAAIPVGALRAVSEIRAVLPAFAELTAEELDMGYRHSRLHESGEIVTEAVFSLKPGDPEEIRATMAELAAKRNAKQPVTYPSAGSFFKRPEGYFAGKLIQDAGLKGLTVGGAQVSQLHSGFIINIGGATATDILQLMQIVRARVQEQFGVLLEPEVRIIGE